MSDVPCFDPFFDQSAQRTQGRIEEKQQDQHAVLVVVQLAIAGFIAPTTHVVQPPQQRQQLVEVL